MSRRRLHPLAALVCWMAVGIVALLFALAWVVSQREVADVQLDRAHLAGMELGQQMCLGLRSELERAPARAPAAHAPGGLL